jgi:hypothetical protein
MSVARLVHRSTSTGQAALLFLLPQGGQHVARRNAWASMATDVARATARSEAAAALTLAVARRQATA